MIKHCNSDSMFQLTKTTAVQKANIFKDKNKKKVI